MFGIILEVGSAVGQSSPRVEFRITILKVSWV